MKIPTRLKIGGHWYEVVRRELDECGKADYRERTITIDSKLNGSSEAVTLIHEIFHVCNSELDHPLLDSLAEQLYQALADNGLLNDA